MRKDNVTIRTLKLYHSFNKKYFPTSFLHIVFSSISPYFNLWMSAEIVTALYEGRDKKAIFTLVAITLLGNLFVHIISTLLSNAVSTQFEKLNNNESLAFNKKTLSLDYDKLEDPEVRMLRRKVKENAYINGYGITYMRNSVNRLMSSAVKIVFSLILFIEMITKMVAVGFHWLGLVLALGMILFAALHYAWGFKQGKLVAAHNKKIGDMMLEENRIGRGTNSTGMDDRIYLQADIIQKLSEKMNKDHLKAFSDAQSLGFKLSIPRGILNWSSTLFNYLLVCFYCAMGAFPVGNVIKYTGYLGRFMGDLNALLDTLFRSFKENEQFLKLYLDYFDIPNDMYQGSLAVEKRSDKKYDIEFRNVSFKYAGSENYALKNVNLTFKVGERLAVVGMNGSGKTTLFRIINGLSFPDKGEYFYKGTAITEAYLKDNACAKRFHKEIGFLFQNPDTMLFNSSVYDEVAFGPRQMGLNDEEVDERVRDCLKLFGIEDLGDKVPYHLSGGQKKWVALASVIALNPEVLVLDEPFAGLDSKKEAWLVDFLGEMKAAGKTLIIASHKEDIIKDLADETFMLG